MIRNRRPKIHSEYYKIPGYQKLNKISDEEMAKKLGMCKRSYKEKIAGYSDFTVEQGKIIATIFGVSQEEIFLV